MLGTAGKIPELEEGYIVGNSYQIIDKIGEGGGGIVYKAKHIRLQKEVVIKQIKAKKGSQDTIRKEADILKQLKHPYLPQVYDFINEKVENQEQIFTVMDFIKGEDLQSVVMRQGKFSQKQVKKWAEQLGEVLAYLHSQNPPIIHSDIKPENVMLMSNGDICLIDFNVSLALGTSAKVGGGTYGYAPPEQSAVLDEYLKKQQEKSTHRITNAIKESESNNVSVNGEGSISDNDKTALLDVSYDDKTEILGMSDDDRTEILGAFDDDRTEILDTLDDKTEILAIPDVAELTMENHADMTGGTESDVVTSTSDSAMLQQRNVLDARSDIYSLGATLYFLLTAKKPSRDFERIIPISQTGIVISEGFSVIIEKMMELTPDKRYQDGLQYLEAIRNCHKLDKRYISMKRKQTGMQFAALACLFVGIILVFLGLYKLRTDKNSTYYALLQKAEECMQAGEYDVASSFLTQAKEEAASRVAAYGDEVYLLFLSGKYEECITIGETYINTMPFVLESKQDKEVFGNIYYIVGNAYFELEEYVNALYLLEGALQYNTQNGLYYRDCAITLAKLGQIDKAQQFLEKSVELGIEQDSVLMVQAELAHANGLYEEALSTLEQVISVTKDDQMKKRAILLSVAVYKAIGNDAIDGEIALLEKYSKVFEEKGSLVMLEYLADAYVRKAGTDASVTDEYYNKALSLFQGILDKGYVTYQLKENMAILYENMDCFEEAEKILLQMAEEYPKRYEVYKRLAYLEADRQQNRDIENRSYDRMREYYEIAKEKYSGKEQDMEMEMLERMMQELQDGGWF